MRNLIAIAMTALVLTPLGAQTPAHSVQLPTYTGSLVDADCKADDVRDACPATAVTKAFGIQTPEGKYMKLDEHGNASVLVDLGRLERKNRNIDRTRPILATITGSVGGEVIKVDAVELYQ